MVPTSSDLRALAEVYDQRACAASELRQHGLAAGLNRAAGLARELADITAGHLDDIAAVGSA